MKVEVIIDDKKHIYHLSKNCDVKLVVRDGVIKDVLEQKRVMKTIAEGENP